MAQEALALALRALGQKERSVAELGRWLHERGVAEDESADVLDHLIAIGTLDDARFAARFAADKRELSGWGRDRIQAALLKRGIARDEIQSALSTAADEDEDELERARDLLRERGVDLGDDRGRRKALGLLARRGYDSELAYQAIASLQPGTRL